MTPNDQRLNPYQPPVDAAPEDVSETPPEVTFRLNKRLRRHAEDHYLLHWHPKLLLLGSLGMIFISCGVMILAINLSPASFLPTMVGVMIVTTAVYSALVHQSKQRIRAGQQAHGLTRDAMMSIALNPMQTTLITTSGSFSWPNSQLKIHRTRKGLLICPEPFLFVFVPKKSHFENSSYRQFAKLIKSRIQTAS